MEYGCVTLTVKLDDTIHDVKKQLLSKLTFLYNKTECQIRLQHAGKELQNNLRLFDYNIVRESTLNLYLRLPGGMENEKKIKTVLQASEHDTNLNEDDVKAAFDNGESDKNDQTDTDAEVILAVDDSANNTNTDNNNNKSDSNNKNNNDSITTHNHKFHDFVKVIEKIDPKDAKKIREKYSFLFEENCYKIFTPKHFIDDSEETAKLFLENEREKFGARLWRTILAVLIPILLFPFAAHPSINVPIISLCGIALLIMFVGYFFHVFSIFGRAKRKPGSVIYRMYSVSAISPEWTSMSVAYRVYAFQNHPIESISEFSAIDGGIAQSMLLTISCYSWATVLCAIAFEAEDKGFKALNFGDVSELIGCFGLVLIGTFDLDPFNSRLQICHYLGALLGTGTIIGFWYQQYKIGNHKGRDVAYHIIGPTILSAVAVTCFLLWQYYGYIADKYPPVRKNRKPGCLEKLMSPCIPEDEPDLSQISNISLKNVFFEAVFLFCGACSMCLWMIYYHECHKNNYCL